MLTVNDNHLIFMTFVGKRLKICFILCTMSVESDDINVNLQNLFILRQIMSMSLKIYDITSHTG